jgi:hypothetical protein
MDERNMEIEEIRNISMAVRGAIADSEAVWPHFWHGFPGGACSEASLVLGAILDDAGHGGFECAWGEIVKPDGTRPSHGWLQRGDLIVDITADQFDDVTESIIVSRDSAWHRKWRVVTMSPGDLKEHKIREVAELYTLYHEVNRLLAHQLARSAVGGAPFP